MPLSKLLKERNKQRREAWMKLLCTLPEAFTKDHTTNLWRERYASCRMLRRLQLGDAHGPSCGVMVRIWSKTGVQLPHHCYFAQPHLSQLSTTVLTIILETGYPCLIPTLSKWCLLSSSSVPKVRLSVFMDTEMKKCGLSSIVCVT